MKRMRENIIALIKIKDDIKQSKILSDFQETILNEDENVREKNIRIKILIT